jgi:adenine-specific DNA-methyltransferase
MAIDLANVSEYPNTISLDERRRSGAVYTPISLVRFILDQAGCTAEKRDAPVLDPACGAGVFLCELLERAAMHIGRGSLPLAGRARRELVTFATRNLFGIDIDPTARHLTLHALRARFQDLAPGPLAPDFLRRNIVEDDFLTGDTIRALPPMRAGGFAYVVGNPPYVSTTRLPTNYKSQLRTLFSTAVGRVDLYTLFFERALQLLRADGILSFITPDKFLVSETSRYLRTYLTKHGSLRRVATFHSHKVFPDAAVVPCVTVIGKQAESDEIRVLTCNSHRGYGVRVTSESRATRNELGAGPWQFRSPDLLQLVDRLRASQPQLDDLARRISAGPATGRDDIYVRPSAEFEHIEAELLRPAIRGRDIIRNAITDAGLRILLPYVFVEDKPRLISLSRFPNARRYLERHRQSLAQRHCVRVWEKAWFDLHDQPATDITCATKIVVPDIAESCRFAVDRGKHFPLHSAYYIVLEDERQSEYVTAILNSTVIEFILRLLSPVAKDGFSRFRRQFLSTLPIPSAPMQERRRIVQLSCVEDRESNERIARLYGIGRAELQRMTSHLATLRGGRS